MRVSVAERELVASFADLSYPLESLNHAEHVRLAWAILAEQPFLDGMHAFRRLLVAYAVHHCASELYNETVTCFYFLLIRERMDQLDADHGWEEFRLANPDLFGSCKAFLES